MNGHLTTEPAKLKKHIAAFNEQLAQGGTDADTFEALSEALFRLALHQDTDPLAATRMLTRARGFDGTNPRYAYHLALIHFKHGRLDQASHWLKKAFLCCPTSHRIWAHLSQLHMELNGHYKSTKYEPGVLKDRGEAIARAIRNGDDQLAPSLLNFRPPISRAQKEAEARQQAQADSFFTARLAKEYEEENPLEQEIPAVPRKLNPGACRWSGVLDLKVERIMEVEPRVPLRDKAAELMGQIKDLTPRRIGGEASLAVLGLQWLLNGYSPAGVLRLIGGGEHVRSSPELKALLQAGDIFQASFAEVPGLLAAGFKNRDLPPLTCALIHHRLLYFNPLINRRHPNYRSFHNRFPGQIRQADALLDGAGGDLSGDAEKIKAGQSLAKTLNNTADDLAACSLPDQIADAASAKEKQRTLSPQTCQLILENLSASAEAIDRVRGQAVKYLSQVHSKACREFGDDESYSQALEDQGRLEELTAAYKGHGEDGLRLCAELTEQVAKCDLAQLQQGFLERLEQCKMSYGAMTMPKALKKKLLDAKNVLGRAEGNFEKHTAEASRAVAGLLQEMLGASPVVAVDKVKGPGEIGNSAGSQGAEEVLADFSSRAAAVCALRGQAVDFLNREHLPRCGSPENQEEYSRARADQACLAGIIEGLVLAGEAGVQALAEFGESLKDMDPSAFSEDFLPRLEACQKTFAELTLPKSLKKKSAKAAKELNRQAAGFGDMAGEASPSLITISKCLAQVMSEATKPDTCEQAEDGPVAAFELEPPSDPKNLAEARERVLKSFESLVNVCLESLEIYGEQGEGEASVRLLKTDLLFHAGLIWQRMGRWHKATEAYGHVLNQDRLHLPTLKNLAVLAAGKNSDHADELAAWRSYCEVLYYQDIVLGDPRKNAALRAEFHQNFAAAYGGGILKPNEKKGFPKVDMDGLISFLNNPGRLESYVAHKRCEFLNRKLDFITPNLILGIDRNISQANRLEAREALNVFLAESAGALPKRVKQGFIRLSERFLDEALNACKVPEGLVKGAGDTYSDEQKAHISWLKEVFETQRIFFVAFLATNRDWLGEITSLDFLPVLDGLWKVPTHLSRTMAESVAVTLGISPSPEETLTGLSQVLTKTVMQLLQRLFNAGAKKDEGEVHRLMGLFRQGFRRYPDFWRCLAEERSGSLGSAFSGMDQALAFAPEGVADAVECWFKDHEAKPDDAKAAEEFCLEWTARYPELTGPWRYLALARLRNNDPGGAEKYLIRAVENGFLDEWRERARDMLRQVKGSAKVQAVNQAIQAKDYLEAVRLLKAELKADPSGASTAKHLLDVYHEWVEHCPELGPELARRIHEDFSQWLSHDKCGLSGEEAAGFKKSVHNLLCIAVLKPQSDVEDEQGSLEVCRAMEGLLMLDKDNHLASFHLMRGLFNQGIALAKRRDLDNAKQVLARSRSLATDLSHNDYEDSVRRNAIKLLDSLDQVYNQLGF